MPPTEHPLLSDDACRVMTVCFYGYFKLLSEFANDVITLPPKIDYLYSFLFTFPLNYLRLLCSNAHAVQIDITLLFLRVPSPANFVPIHPDLSSNHFEDTRIWATSPLTQPHLTPSYFLPSTSETIFKNVGQPP